MIKSFEKTQGEGEADAIDLGTSVASFTRSLTAHPESTAKNVARSERGFKTDVNDGGPFDLLSIPLMATRPSSPRVNETVSIFLGMDTCFTVP